METLVGPESQPLCRSRCEPFGCERNAGHDGKHMANASPTTDPDDVEIVCWAASPVATLPDDQLLLHRQMLLAQRRQVLNEISAAISEAEAEIEVRVERNGGRALLAHQDGLIVKAEVSDQYTPWVYDIPGLREISKVLPEKEAAKIVKHVEERITIEPAHDVAGNPRSIEALISKYGEHSAVGKALSECRQRGHVGRKLTITAEGER